MTDPDRPTRTTNTRSRGLPGGTRPRSARLAGVAAQIGRYARVYVETEGFEAVISVYLYGLVGLALLVLVSPLIVFSVPLIALLAAPTVAWWRGRARQPRMGSLTRSWLTVSSGVVFLAPIIPAIWYAIGRNDGAPPESFWLSAVGLVLLPFPLAAIAYQRRTRAVVAEERGQRRRG